jgi:hypothetical protein
MIAPLLPLRICCRPRIEGIILLRHEQEKTLLQLPVSVQIIRNGVVFLIPHSSSTATAGGAVNHKRDARIVTRNADPLDKDVHGRSVASGSELWQ